MPYLPEEQRALYIPWIKKTAQNPGQLCYQLSALLEDYLHWHGKSYSTMNDILGALEGAKLEFQRCVVGPHEEDKRIELGNLYGDGE